jgi:radical SAM-linked protein
MDVVHDRAAVEVMRGCAQSCRFCQAGYLYRPLRELPRAAIERLVDRALAGTGYEEISLASLSIADLACLPETVPSLMARLAPERVSLSLPSLRVEALNRQPDLAEEIGRVRKTGFTIAPEAGSARLRRVINKTGFDEDEILTAVERAARAGWESVKFYFMIGLPTETSADLDELVRVARAAAGIARRQRARGFGLTVSASSFVPKPHTPFQWCAQEPREVLQEKQAFLKARLREARIDFKWHRADASFLEAVFSLGGRELADVVVAAARRGCRFDGWTEQLRFEAWEAAFQESGVDPGAIANRARGLDEPLPWDHIDCGVSSAFLQREYRRALAEQATPDCHVGPCSNCGEVCAPNWRRWAERIDAGAGDQGPGGGEPGSRAPSSISHLPTPGAPPANSSPEAASPAAGSGAPVQKIQFEYQKVGALRYLSHLEVMRALARALRRARLPLAYSQGFNPQPRLSLAQALAVGVAGLREPGELELVLRCPPEEVRERWNAHLPPELKILRTWEAPLHGPALSAGVRGAAYRIQLTPNGWERTLLAAIGTAEACAAFAARDSIPVEATKKGRAVCLDARPLLQAFAPLPEPGTPTWEMRLRIGPTGSVKPQAVMRSFLAHWAPAGELDRMVSSLRITRTALALEGQG